METVKNKILIVEDDKIIRYLIEVRLNKLGYFVCGEASNGLDSVKLAHETNPDAIIMDFLLDGDMDGIEAAQLIREKHNIPIIFLTAHSDEKILERIITLRPVQYILKPFGDDDLRIALKLSLG
jgi:CheY-like chemotaxis protein